jgi:hypothetical protein
MDGPCLFESTVKVLKKISVERHIVYLTERFADHVVAAACAMAAASTGSHEEGQERTVVHPFSWLDSAMATCAGGDGRARRGMAWGGAELSCFRRLSKFGSRKEPSYGKPSRPRLSYRLTPVDESTTDRTVNITLMTSNDETSAVYLHDPTRQSTTALASSSRVHSYTSLPNDELSSPLP